MMGASAAAVVILIKEKHIVAAFESVGAISAPNATTPASIGVQERVAFHKLLRRAILRDAGAGRFYLDVASWEALRRTRRRMALAIRLLVLAAALWQFVRG
jgi:hypothetical protein